MLDWISNLSKVISKAFLWSYKTINISRVYSSLCYDVCSESISWVPVWLQKNFSITQILQLLVQILSPRNTKWMKKTAPSWTEPQRNTQNTFTSNIYHLPQFTICVIRHTHPFGVLQPSIQFQIILPPPHLQNSQVATLLTYTSTNIVQVFLKAKWHIYNSIYILHNHLICVKLLLFLLDSYILFYMSLENFFTSCP